MDQYKKLVGDRIYADDLVIMPRTQRHMIEACRKFENTIKCYQFILKLQYLAESYFPDSR